MGIVLGIGALNICMNSPLKSLQCEKSGMRPQGAVAEVKAQLCIKVLKAKSQCMQYCFLNDPAIFLEERADIHAPLTMATDWSSEKREARLTQGKLD